MEYKNSSHYNKEDGLLLITFTRKKALSTVEHIRSTSLGFLRKKILLKSKSVNTKTSIELSSIYTNITMLKIDHPMTQIKQFIMVKK